jgi:glyceraldehyde-3-phosphate dehydrogenase (NADP+)
MLLAGKWTESKETIKVRNPFDGSVVDEVAKAGRPELERATAAAVAAFETTRKLSSGARSSILAAASAGLARRKEEIARTICLEAGKPIKLARGEVDRAAHTFSVAADEARRIGGEVIPLDVTAASEGRLGITRRFLPGAGPLTSFASCSTSEPFHKLAARASAAGNPFVHKPASARRRSRCASPRQGSSEAGAPPESRQRLAFLVRH